ncbi:MAG: hypothetical protein CMB78_00620 [Euryarchaeota archaeon]|nr:hypothetical protein [Euryarchaeota archaeon]
MNSESRPTSLIVHENRITSNRVRSIMSQRGWESEICHDGDKAVDEYVRIKPDMVFMGLNLPTMDGHVAALEMRESDPSARIVFVVSKARLEKANDAAFSAGAVAVLVTPLTRSDFDKNWVLMNGPIPDAPGLADLDKLYPELDEEEPTPPPLPEIPMPEPPTIPQLPNTKEPKRRRLPRIIAILFSITALAGVAVFFGVFQT